MSHSQYQFIVIEGIDGAGKSTVSQIVANKLNATVIETPQGWWRTNRHIVENANPTIRFLYYVIANFFSSGIIKKQLKKSHIVCGRFIHSTKAHHIAYGSKVADWMPLSMLSSIKPDLVYYLAVDQVERERRIRNRPGNTEKDLDSEALNRTHQIFCKLPNMTLVDTTNMNEKQVADFICNDIFRKTGSPP